MLDLAQIDLLITALVFELLSLLVSTKEEANSTDNDLLVVGQTSLLHNIDRLRIGPELSLPHLAGKLDGPDSSRRVSVGGDEVVEDGLHGTIERMVDGLCVGVSEVGQNLLEKSLT
jgi:hypothetical protein